MLKVYFVALQMKRAGCVTHIAALLLQEFEVDLALFQLVVDGEFLLLRLLIPLPEI